MKTKYSERSKNIQFLSGLDYRQVVVHQPATRAGLHLTRRYRIHPAIADTIATLAGLGATEGR